jgi:hypothetical protein
LRLKKLAFAVSRFGARQIRLIPALFAGVRQTADLRSAPIRTSERFFSEDGGLRAVRVFDLSFLSG